MIPKLDEVLFLPLGGVGEIGMNLALYGHDGAWVIVDLGITFGGDDFPEQRVMMADPSFIAARRERVSGILLTHGHEDHIGALPYLWRRLRCPIYATPFTAALVRYRLAQAGLEDATVEEVSCGERFQIGPFGVEYIGMTHSIPEPNAILLRTAAGAVLHTGDWKLDDRPVVGRRYDAARLSALRRESLLALVGDSTNAVVPGTTGSEGDLFEPLRELAEQATGRVVVTSFASNVARLVTLARVAESVGRRFGVVGPAMERMVAVARGTGYWPEDLPELVDARHLGFLPREEVFAACTGSQGEPGSALMRMAADRHRDLLLDHGDSVIFSSKLIPGNERSVERLQARLRALGVEVTTDTDAEIHVSGHPAQGDLARLYGWIQPPLLIPVHGTPRHLAANAAVAKSCHIPQVRLMANGDLCRLTPQGAQLLGSVESGRLSLGEDGRLVPVSGDLLEEMRGKAH
ncbi:ribonuclease J [Thiorhodococcus mannitoliphagus]|uniref:Ribonuclease J n=1 Tax=Thiorhodococcus mannitoliphagus TaxID=329406 RepID=A0A6P1DTC7_9GAMM|nr:ribonuclease J [Thiorhodococcus mannitoliphagus]